MSQAKLPKDNAWEAFEKTSGDSRDAYKIEQSKNCWIIRKFDKNSIAMGEAPWAVADSGEVPALARGRACRSRTTYRERLS